MTICIPYRKICSWNLNFAISPMAYALALISISAYYYIFRNLSMIAYINEIQKSKFANS